MRKFLVSIVLLVAAMMANAQKPDTLWYQYANRFVANEVYDLSKVDSVVFKKTQMQLFNDTTLSKLKYLTKSYPKENGNFHFDKMERQLALSSTYSNCDFTNENSQFCFQRSAESEHFVIFWEKGMTKKSNGDITYSGYTCNVTKMLNDAEKIWKCYVEELGFLTPGNSTTDKFKIEMYIVKAAWDGSDWRADGSGTDAKYYAYSGSTKSVKNTKVGVFHCTTRAATGRNGHTLAHEIGHTFQYLVGADSNFSHGMSYGLGQGNDNEWWEDCANWQAYKVYPQYQYSDGEYYEQYLNKHHLNIHHEDIRYASCYYHDYWCQLHGMNTVGRVWREANASKREDPSQVYMRIFGLDEAGYADEMYQAFAHLASIDIDGVRSYGKAKIGLEPQRLVEPSEAIRTKYLGGDNLYWIVAPEYCPQNYGYNANPLKVPASGTVVKASFKGLSECTGYNKVNSQYAGWRYGLVAYTSDGTRVYSDMGSDKEGEVSITVPEKCKNIWFVVMGAPTKYWSHSWTNGQASSTFAGNNEQWPYAVKFSGTDPLGAKRTYGDYPEDYVRKDTTVVINATLAYSSSDYSSVNVLYDMDAISQALGVSTKQMQALKRNAQPGTKGTLVFAGVNANKTTYNYNTTTSTSTNTCYGHWFNSSGNVCNYDTSACVYAELNPNSYVCKVGQYPGHLAKGRTYIIRQAVVYTHTDGKQYKAIMEVHLSVI